MSHNQGESVTVDICGGRLKGKITAIKQSWNEDVYYQVHGKGLITQVREEFINVKGPATCPRLNCHARKICTLLKVKA